jgi:hypothetical protein
MGASSLTAQDAERIVGDAERFVNRLESYLRQRKGRGTGSVKWDCHKRSAWIAKSKP